MNKNLIFWVDKTKIEQPNFILSKTTKEINIVYNISCSMNGAYAIVDNHLLAWIPHSENIYTDSFDFLHQTPIDFQNFGTKKISKIFCNSQITHALSDDGLVYSWGVDREKTGILGLGYSYSHSTPVLNSNFSSKTIIEISLSERHAVAVDNKYNVYTWGTGEDGELGQGLITFANIPTLVPFDRNSFISKAKCGPGYTCFVYLDGTVGICGKIKLAKSTNTIALLEGVEKIKDIFTGVYVLALIDENGTMFIYNEHEGMCRIIIDKQIKSAKISNSNIFAVSSDNTRLYEFTHRGNSHKFLNYFEKVYDISPLVENLSLIDLPYYSEVLFFSSQAATKEIEKKGIKVFSASNKHFSDFEWSQSVNVSKESEYKTHMTLRTEQKSFRNSIFDSPIIKRGMVYTTNRSSRKENGSNFSIEREFMSPSNNSSRKENGYNYLSTEGDFVHPTNGSSRKEKRSNFSMERGLIHPTNRSSRKENPNNIPKPNSTINRYESPNGRRMEKISHLIGNIFDKKINSINAQLNGTSGNQHNNKKHMEFQRQCVNNYSETMKPKQNTLTFQIHHEIVCQTEKDNNCYAPNNQRQRYHHSDDYLFEDQKITNTTEVTKTCSPNNYLNGRPQLRLTQDHNLFKFDETLLLNEDTSKYNLLINQNLICRYKDYDNNVVKNKCFSNIYDNQKQKVQQLEDETLFEDCGTIRRSDEQINTLTGVGKSVSRKERIVTEFENIFKDPSYTTEKRAHKSDEIITDHTEEDNISLSRKEILVTGSKNLHRDPQIKTEQHAHNPDELITDQTERGVKCDQIEQKVVTENENLHRGPFITIEEHANNSEELITDQTDRECKSLSTKLKCFKQIDHFHHHPSIPTEHYEQNSEELTFDQQDSSFYVTDTDYLTEIREEDEPLSSKPNSNRNNRRSSVLKEYSERISEKKKRKNSAPNKNNVKIQIEVIMKKNLIPMKKKKDRKPPENIITGTHNANKTDIDRIKIGNDDNFDPREIKLEFNSTREIKFQLNSPPNLTTAETHFDSISTSKLISNNSVTTKAPVTQAPVTNSVMYQKLLKGKTNPNKIPSTTLTLTQPSTIKAKPRINLKEIKQAKKNEASQGQATITKANKTVEVENKLGSPIKSNPKLNTNSTIEVEQRQRSPIKRNSKLMSYKVNDVEHKPGSLIKSNSKLNTNSTNNVEQIPGQLNKTNSKLNANSTIEVEQTPGSPIKRNTTFISTKANNVEPKLGSPIKSNSKLNTNKKNDVEIKLGSPNKSNSKPNRNSTIEIENKLSPIKMNSKLISNKANDVEQRLGSPIKNNSKLNKNNTNDVEQRPMHPNKSNSKLNTNSTIEVEQRPGSPIKRKSTFISNKPNDVEHKLGSLIKSNSKFNINKTNDVDQRPGHLNKSNSKLNTNSTIEVERRPGSPIKRNSKFISNKVNDVEHILGSPIKNNSKLNTNKTNEVEQRPGHLNKSNSKLTSNKVTKVEQRSGPPIKSNSKLITKRSSFSKFNVKPKIRLQMNSEETDIKKLTRGNGSFNTDGANTPVTLSRHSSQFTIKVNKTMTHGLDDSIVKLNKVKEQLESSIRRNMSQRNISPSTNTNLVHAKWDIEDKELINFCEPCELEKSINSSRNSFCFTFDPVANSSSANKQKEVKESESNSVFQLIDDSKLFPLRGKSHSPDSKKRKEIINTKK